MPSKKKPRRAGAGALAVAPAVPQFVFDVPAVCEWIDLPAPYEGERIYARVNVGEAEFIGRQWTDVLTEYVAEWSLKLKDGTVAPITADAINAMPPHLLAAIQVAWQERRLFPLAPRSTLFALLSKSSEKPSSAPEVAAS